MPSIDLVTPVDLLDGIADDQLLDADGRIRSPLLAVNLDGELDATLRPRVAEAIRRSDRLLIGVARRPDHPLGPALDLSLVPSGSEPRRHAVMVADVGGELESLCSAVEANPAAALVLAALLRRSSTMGVRDALDAESLAYSTLLGGAEFARWLDARGPRPVPPDCTDPVLLRRDGSRVTITLNRPERRNAFGRQLRDGLVEALRLACLDTSIGRIRIDGAGPVFCSGGDLDEFGTTPDLTTAHFVRTRGGAGLLLHRLTDRTEVWMTGACVGAGIELPAFAGRVVAAPGTTFRLPELGMGLIPGAGGTVSLPRRIGRWRTLYLALTGRPLQLDEASAWGLVDAVAPKD